MRKLIVLCWMFLAMLASVQAQQVYTPDNLPNIHLQNEMRYTVNPDGILSVAVCDSIDRMLYQLEQEKGVESVVAAVSSIGEMDCFDFCHELLNKWGVGKKDVNNGFVMLLVTDQRCIQIYTGYGLEGVLPDAICKRIQVQKMIPHLKHEDWNQGMLEGVRDITLRLSDPDYEGGGTTDAREKDPSDFYMGIIIALFIFGGLGVTWWSMRKESKCPNCGKHALQRTASLQVSKRDGIKTEDVTFTCQNCGHVLTRRIKTRYSTNRNHRGGGGGPFIFGGGGGSHYGGGGFSGGSFGGGAGGGGGAGSKF